MSVLKEHPPSYRYLSELIPLALITGLLACLYRGYSQKMRSLVLPLIVYQQSICCLSVFYLFAYSLFFSLLVTCTFEYLTLINTVKMVSLPVGERGFLPAVPLTWWAIFKIFLLSCTLIILCSHSKYKNSFWLWPFSWNIVSFGTDGEQLSIILSS